MGSLWSADNRGKVNSLQSNRADSQLKQIGHGASVSSLVGFRVSVRPYSYGVSTVRPSTLPSRSAARAGPASDKGRR